MKEVSLLTQFKEITSEQWFMAAGLLAAGWVLKKIVIFIIKRLMKLAERTDNDFDDILLRAIRRPISWMCFLLGMWMAMAVLQLPTKPIDLDRFATAFMKSATIFIGFWLVVRLVSGLIKSAEEKARATNTQLAGVLPLARKTLVITMWIIASLIALQNIGYSVTSLLAGIGIGGAALAFAAKDTLANFFGSIVIFVDKPFAIGDWVKVGAIEGTVEEISLRVTRVRTFERSLITIPNQDLTTKPIENFSRMEKRRLKFEIGVGYDTSIEKLEAVVNAIRARLADNDALHKEAQYAHYSRLDGSSLIILVQCFTISTEYADYLTVRHNLLINIKREFEKLDIMFAFPTQTMIIAESGKQGSSEFPPTVS